MKKCSIVFVCLFMIMTFTESSAGLKLSLPGNFSNNNSTFDIAAGNRLSLVNNDLKSNLNLSLPANTLKTQSEASGKMMVGLGLILGLPTEEGFSTGIGFNGTFSYMLYPYLVLTGSLGYVSWGLDDDFFIDDASASSVPLLFGAKYIFPTTSAFSPYVLGELGLVFNSIDFGFERFGGFGDYDASSTDFCLGLGGGFMYPLSAMLLLDVNLRYWVTDLGSFALQAGVAYSLGGM